MPHSFSVLNLATCDSNRLACAPNHGCQTVTCAPRNALGSTFKLLTAAAGVLCSDGFSVDFGDGGRGLASVEIVLEHAEMRRIHTVNASQSLREAVMLIGHH